MLALYSRPDQDDGKNVTLQDCLAAGNYINAYCGVQTLMRVVESHVYQRSGVIGDGTLHRVDKVEEGNSLPYDSSWVDVTTNDLKTRILGGYGNSYSRRYIRVTGEWGYGTWTSVPADPVPDGIVARLDSGDSMVYVYRASDEWLTLTENAVASVGADDTLVQWVPPADLNIAAQSIARQMRIVRTTDGSRKQGVKKTWEVDTKMFKYLLSRFIR